MACSVLCAIHSTQYSVHIHTTQFSNRITSCEHHYLDIHTFTDYSLQSADSEHWTEYSNFSRIYLCIYSIYSWFLILSCLFCSVHENCVAHRKHVRILEYILWIFFPSFYVRRLFIVIIEWKFDAMHNGLAQIVFQ